MAKKKTAEGAYSEADLRQAFLCGVKHGQGTVGDPAAVAQNWIDCLFYEGFSNMALFNRPGYNTHARQRRVSSMAEKIPGELGEMFTQSGPPEAKTEAYPVPANRKAHLHGAPTLRAATSPKKGADMAVGNILLGDRLLAVCADCRDHFKSKPAENWPVKP